MLRISDKIPEGKIISTIHGGAKALQLSLEKLKKFEFTGYILTQKETSSSISQGILVVKDGVLNSAIYGRLNEDNFIATKMGEEGLKLTWADSYDKESTLEVHGRLDINTILTEYPDARVTKGGEKVKVKKRRTRFSLAWGEEAEEHSNAEHKEVPEDLKKMLEEWKSQGYVVKALNEALKMDVEQARILFQQFEANVKRAKFLKIELEELDTRKFNMDTERIKAMLKNPSKLTAVEAALQGLKVKVEQERAREAEEKLAEMMAEKEAEKKAEEPEEDIDDFELSIPEEEKLASQGDIFPPPIEEDDKCTICGAELHGRKECPACGDEKSLTQEPQPKGEANLISEFTFDSFVVGECNRFSQAAATAVSKIQSSAYNPLLICSGAGLGKTHLLNAIGNYVVDNYSEKKVLYVSAEKFMNEFIEATKSNKKRQFRKIYRDLDFLLLDDIHFIAGQEAVQDEFFHTFNTLYKDGKQIVMTCDRSIREVPGIKDRLISRFEAGLITDMQPAAVETRLAILKKKVEGKRLVIGDDILLYIAKRYTKNIRTLEGGLKTLTAYSELMNVPPTLDVAKQALKDEPMDVPEPDEKPEEMPVDDVPLERKTRKLKVGHSYLIEEEKPVKCFEYFVDNLNMGLKGIAIIRMNPKRVKDNYDVGEAQMLWLTDREGDPDNRITPGLEKIIYKIEDFLNSPGKSILLIDGLDYLISNNSFDAVLRFLRRLIDEISESDTVFLMSLTPETIDEQGLKILEREMEIISFLDE